MKNLLMWLLLACPLWLAAHDMHYEVRNEQAIVVELFFGNGHKFSYHQYEVFSPTQSIAVQVGRTDRHGRLVFLPDEAGSWRVKVFAEDGHGADFSVTIDAGQVLAVSRPFLQGYLRIVAGVGILLGIFAVLGWRMGRKKRLKQS
jgi:nickel transport protein